MERKTNFYQKSGERIDIFYQSDLQILQRPSGFCFGTDSVLLAQLASLKKRDRICDFGTGTGIIPLLLSRRQQNVRIVALELNSMMAEMAQRTLFLNGLQDRISILEADVLTASQLLGKQTFDLVISNPPYRALGHGKISPNADKALARHAPQNALEGWIENASLLLKEKGRLAVILQPQRLVDLLALCRQYYVEPKRLIMIQPSPQQSPNLFFLEGIKGAAKGLIVEKPLIVYTSQGEYSPEILSLYQNSGRQNV